jgi:hypothetical protein
MTPQDQEQFISEVINSYRVNGAKSFLDFQEAIDKTIRAFSALTDAYNKATAKELADEVAQLKALA